MKKEKTIANENFLRGVSTLDFVAKNLRQPILLLVFAIIFSGFVYAGAGHSILDAVDPNFNTQVQTNSFSAKFVAVLKVLPDNKMLASGHFNTYNGQPVGSLIRLNADGSLDTTFNNNLLSPFSFPNNIAFQSDGKIIISGLNLALNGQNAPTAPVLRLNADGTLDPTFNYTLRDAPAGVTVDASGRTVLAGYFQVTENGVPASRFLIRLKSDGSHDESFKFQSSFSIERIAAQNNKIIVGQNELTNNVVRYVVARLNEDGTPDVSFARTPLDNYALRDIRIQPDNKVLTLSDGKLCRLNENGGEDPAFQTYSFPRQPRNINLTANGKITIGYGNSPSEGYKIIRVLPNGLADPTFSVYTYLTYGIGATEVQSDGSLVIGDNNSGFGSPIGSNGFMRLLPSGLPDSDFNDGGTGFQNVSPGSIRAITVQGDDKILIAGRFDSVSGVPRSKIARLNSDTTLDSAFQLNMTATGNYFSIINDIYTVRSQADGKIILTGDFVYFLNGVQKHNMVRLYPNGSIDASFNLSVNVTDFFPSGGGQNRFTFQIDGKIFVGMSRGGYPGTTPAIRLNASGSVDGSFTATTYNEKIAVYIMDVAIQPDGKILIGGRYVNEPSVPGSESGIVKNFLARLNSNGTRDETFLVSEEEGKEISAFKLLSDGKILAAKLDGVYNTSKQSIVQRLNADGSLDNSFNAGIGANGKINALLVLPDGKILLGGNFKTFNNQPRANLAKLNADGALDATIYTVNQEVLSLTLDNEQRALVGGSFTTISAGSGQSYTRSYVARLIDSKAEPGTLFDFDGDGKADVSVFRPESEVWHLLHSRSNYAAIGFGISTDKLVPADYDGDGKTDLAVFRENPSDPGKAKFYTLQSSNNQFREEQFGASGDIPVSGDWDGDGKSDIGVYRAGITANPQGYFYYRPSSQPTVNFIPYPWGIAGDKPVVADYDGDGKADPAVFRPSNGAWYIQQSRDGFYAIQFGATEDKLVVGDYDGDGKADQAVFRPSNGVWYIWRSKDGFAAAQFGISTDKPAPADYDGDGKTDFAVYRDGNWFILNSTSGFAAIGFGNATDKPVPNVFVP